MSKPLTSAQRDLVDKLRAGWLLHFNLFCRPPRGSEGAAPFSASRSTVNSLEARGLVEFTHRSDYWSLTEMGRVVPLEPTKSAGVHCPVSVGTKVTSVSAAAAPGLSHEQSPWEIKRYQGTTIELYTVSRLVGKRRIHMKYASDGSFMLWSLERAREAIAEAT